MPGIGQTFPGSIYLVSLSTSSKPIFLIGLYSNSLKTKRNVYMLYKFISWSLYDITEVEKEGKRTGAKEIMFEKIVKEKRKAKKISKNHNKVEKVDIVKRMNEEIRMQSEEIRQKDKGKNELNALENNVKFEQTYKRQKKEDSRKKFLLSLCILARRGICVVMKSLEKISSKKEKRQCLNSTFMRSFTKQKPTLGYTPKKLLKSDVKGNGRKLKESKEPIR